MISQQIAVIQEWTCEIFRAVFCIFDHSRVCRLVAIAYLSSSKWGLSKRFFARQHPACRFIPLPKLRWYDCRSAPTFSYNLFHSRLHLTFENLFEINDMIQHIFSKHYTSHKWSSLVSDPYDSQQKSADSTRHFGSCPGRARGGIALVSAMVDDPGWDRNSSIKWIMLAIWIAWVEWNHFWSEGLGVKVIYRFLVSFQRCFLSF